MIEQSEVLFGSKRLISSVKQNRKTLTVSIYNATEIASFLKEHSEYHTAGILYSGDIGFFSGAKTAWQVFPDWEIQPVCGISSAAYLCNHLGVPWNEVFFLSCHGRNPSVISALRNHSNVLLLMGNQLSVGDLCQMLCEYHLEDVMVSVGENLSYPEEKIISAPAKELCQKTFASLSVVFLRQLQFKKPIVTCGIADEEFIRGSVPMTKQEVRVISLSKLFLHPDDCVYDIGAGTGSVSVEIARLLPQGRVYAIERSREAISLIEQNKRKFCCDNLLVIEGTAPEAMDGLPTPDKAFIGGSSGRMNSILEKLIQINPNVRVVMNVISIESLHQALEGLKQYGFEEPEIVQVGISKAKLVGTHHMMIAQNPVYVISAGR